MAGFANGGCLQEPVAAEPAPLAALSRALAPSGLPRLALVDQGSIFKGALMELLQLLGAPVEPVAPESHEAARCERLRRRLSKAQVISAAHKHSFRQRRQGVTLALHARSAGPVDGADAP